MNFRNTLIYKKFKSTSLFYKIKPIYSCYDLIVKKIIYAISPTWLTKRTYKRVFKRKLDLDNPITFNEKIQWLKLHCYTNNFIIQNCIDKYNVRDYVEKCGLKDILVPNYGVFNDIDEIDFDKIPNKFIIKGTSGCGYNILVKNKNEFDFNKAKSEFKKYKKTRYDSIYAETHYVGIKNRIICEKYLDDNLSDYKFFCFNGEPKFLYVSSGLVNKNGEHLMSYFDMDFNIINVTREGYNLDKSIKKPRKFDEMIEIAKKLSKMFPFVRVDLYNLNGKIYFGELTFVPTGGFMKLDPDKYDYEWGKYLDLSKYK